MAARLVALVVAAGLAVVGRGGWVDPATDEAHKTATSLVDGRKMKLVMSDEFNTEGRNFKDGHDPIWTALDHSDDDMSSTGGGSIHYYNSTHVTTKDGMLDIWTSTDSTSWRGYNPYKHEYEVLEKPFRSGMVQSWNKFCFTGGVVEISAQLPGRGYTQGLWPAFWLLGNLGRATYEKSTNLVWPWSYDKCDRHLQDAQEISACDKTAHYGLNDHQGRGATEIDIIEAMPGFDEKPLPSTNTKRPYVSTSLQVAPGVEGLRPQNGGKPNGKQQWYEGLEYGANSSMNVYFYGTLMEATSKYEVAGRTKTQAYQCDAISAISQVNTSHFDEQHVYRLEWMPGAEGHLRWYIDGEMMHSINGTGLSMMGSVIPREPSYLILNTAVSTTWGFPQPCPTGCDCKCFDCKRAECQCALPPGFCNYMEEDEGAHYLVDYIRIYQDPEEERHSLSCDPEDYPTRRFIQAHAGRYIGPQDKLWYGKPLRDVYKGGGACHHDSDCGKESSCAPPTFLEVVTSLSFGYRCRCAEGFAGPNCHVFDAHDDNEHQDEDVPHVRPFAPYFPGFLWFAGLMAIGLSTWFVLSFGRDEARRHKETTEGRYDRLT
mmetsp:Transcript_9358/g.27472  ORF Transcript_9358/g.27472 Transcript_9358/m.27472 type:complete len:599 (-) Transcript_9358:240-2036(-)